MEKRRPRSGRSRSRIGHLHVQMTPQIISAKVRMTPPSYTRKPVFEGALPKDGIVGLATFLDFALGAANTWYI